MIQIKNQLKLGQENQQLFPILLGFSFLIYNGKKFISLTISEDMVGHKFGEFAPTRQFFGHTPADKKAKIESEAKNRGQKINMAKIKKTIDTKLVKSVNKNVRSSVKKLKPILKSIVGKKVDIAIRNLSFSEKRISKDIKKTISSAIANAENNFQYDIDKLIVKEAYCGKQVVMKRFRPRAKGRASPIMKPYSNLTIILTEKTKQTESHGSKS